MSVFLLSFCTFTAGFAFHDAWSGDLLTRDQAISILIEQVINPSPNKDILMAFGPQNMLQVGDVVEPVFIGTQPYPGNSFSVSNPTWFFWVNDEPDSRFAHHCRFVYIDVTHSNPLIGDGIIVETQGWWPKINSVEFYKNGPLVSPDLAYGTSSDSLMNRCDAL